MNTTPFRCHDADACASGQNACPTPSICGCAAPACAVKDGTHKPADAVHQIAEPALQALRERMRFTHARLGHAERFVEAPAAVVAEVIKLADRQAARIAELEKAESDLIAQRDHCEEIIDRMADAVLGKDRPEWSSNYDFIDAAQEVEDRVAELQEKAAAQQAVQADTPTDDELRMMWIAAGGDFFGPKTVTGSMPESKLLPLLRRFAATHPTQQGLDALNQAIEAMQLALSSHDIQLLSYPPQDAWASRQVGDKLRTAISTLAAQAKQGGA